MSGSDSGLDAVFTFESETKGVVNEHPFRLLVLGSWSGDAARPVVNERAPIEIDRDNFDSVLQKLGTRLDLNQSDGSKLSFQFRGIDDFHPDNLFRSLPIFAEMRELRSRLLDPYTFNDAARQIRSWMNIGTEVVRPSVDDKRDGPTADLLDSIISGRENDRLQPAAAGTGDVARLVSDLVRPHLISVDENEQSALLAAIDAVIADLMRRILHDRRFQALEAAWRGLYLLVRRAETGPDLKISILDIQKDELLNNLKSHNNLEDSSVFRFLVKNIPVGFGGSEPWSAVIGDYAFLPNVEDVAGLVRIAKIASDARAPFISHIRPDVLGITSLADDPDPTYWNGDDMSNERKLWEALRGIPEAKYLAMTMPRMLGRLPYGRETDPLETFSFEEFEGMPSHNDYLWANGCYAAGLLLARTFSANGWEMNRGFCLDVERLPMHVYESNGETVVQPCSEVILSERACEVLIDSGILPLIAFKNSDHLKLAGFRSIAAHGSALAGRWT